MLPAALDKWIMASVAKHFKDRSSWTVYTEGEKRDTSRIEQFIEVRVDGPDRVELSDGEWDIYIEVNILLQSAKTNADIYRIRTMAGTVASYMTECIPIYKYGSDTGDDGSYYCSVTRLDDKKRREKTKVAHFGQVEPNSALEQAVVEAHYSAILFE